MPARILITEGTRADCKQAVHLIEGISAQVLLADGGYDTNGILAYAGATGAETVIYPKKNRKEQCEYNRYLYKLRHLVENCFLILKRWRGIATRYANIHDLTASLRDYISFYNERRPHSSIGNLMPIQAENKY